MDPKISEILSELKQRLTELYGERLERLVLFGSRARGDAEPDSDIDILVVLRGEVNSSKELDKISYVTSELSIKSGYMISTVVASEKEFEQRRAVFENVRQEGKLL